MRTALVAASAVFQDLGDMRKTEYLEGIVFDALVQGLEMKDRVSVEIKKAGFKITEDRIRKVVGIYDRLSYRSNGKSFCWENVIFFQTTFLIPE